MSILAQRDHRFTPAEIAAANAAIDRSRAEIETLAAVADGVRQGFALLAECGVALEHFTEEDCRAIYLVLRWAADPAGPPRAKAEIVDMCRWLLSRLGHWDARDDRPFVAGSRWGPGPLARLMTAIDYDPDLVRAAAVRLLALDRPVQTGGRRCA